MNSADPCALQLPISDPNHVQGVWRYRQTDPRYANERLGSLSFSQAGSGPCAIANIVDRKPTEVLAWLKDNAYVGGSDGISWDGIPAALQHFGASGELLCDERLSAEPAQPCFEQFKEHLRAGQPGIILFAQGSWSKSTHFVSVVGYREEEDALLLYDPMGEERDGWYPWKELIAQAQTCITATVPEESKYSPRYIYKQAFGTSLAGHEQYWPAIEHEVLSRINPCYIGWIHLEQSPINYPIVKARLDKLYFLNRNFSNEKSCHGCVTLSFAHGGIFSGPNILLSAHDMRDGSMFASMLRYDEPEWSQAHPIIELQLPDASYTAKVFSAYAFNLKPQSQEEARSPKCRATKLHFDSDKDVESWAQERLALSAHPFDATPKPGDSFISFTTCNGEFGYDSYVVHAILKPSTAEKAQ